MTTLKIPALIILLLFFFGTFEGCNSNQSKTVGLLLHQQDDRWSMDVKYLTEYFQNEGIKLIIKDAEGDENRQIKQAEELVKEGVGVILIVAVNQNTAAGIVRFAHENRIKVVGYDRLIKNADLDYLLSFEYKQIGTDLAKYAHNKVPKGNYVLLWGDASDDNARVMQKAQMEYLQPYIDAGNVNVVYKAYIDDWNYENALHKMNKILDFSDEKIDVVLANNDRLAVGALDALKAHNYTHSVLITGHDATLEACGLIAQGEI
jgi:D-xylose transport system substrate-binding protein